MVGRIAPGRPGLKWWEVSLLTLPLVLSGCTLGDPVARQGDITIQLSDSGTNCFSRDVGGSPVEACFTRRGDTVAFRANGLDAGSAVEIEGSNGDTLELLVESDGSVSSELGGTIVDSTFAARGTWADLVRMEVIVTSP